jgi:hypothetical protein
MVAQARGGQVRILDFRNGAERDIQLPQGWPLSFPDRPGLTAVGSN